MEILNAHFYLISNRTGFNVYRAFKDILVQAYNKYHWNDLIPTGNYYKESRINNINNEDIYSNIHLFNEKPKMKEKEKKKIDKQEEKELNYIKKMKMQKEISLNKKKRKKIIYKLLKWKKY